ncbi:unnamed protein product [Sphagnum balticum]
MMEDANGPLAHDQGTQSLEGMVVSGPSRMVTMGVEEFAKLIKYVVQAELAVARQERVELQVGQPLYVEAPATNETNENQEKPFLSVVSFVGGFIALAVVELLLLILCVREIAELSCSQEATKPCFLFSD